VAANKHITLPARSLLVLGDRDRSERTMDHNPLFNYLENQCYKSCRVCSQSCGHRIG
jgi:hypothetical protein